MNNDSLGNINEGGLRTRGVIKKSQNGRPLISVVTIVYNGESYLEDTIKSVLDQDYLNIEYIIVDGGSTDASVDIIKKYSDSIDYWISEADNGIYDAFNKGIALCTGDFVGLINADDYYAKGAISRVVSRVLEDPSSDVIYGDMYLHNDKYNRKKLMQALDLSQLSENICVNHPTCFVRRKIYDTIQFDTRYRLSADYDFIVKLNKEGYVFSYIPEILAHMRDGGASTSFYKAEKETFEIRKKYFGAAKARLAYIKKLIKHLIKSQAIRFISEEKWIKKRYND